MNNAQNAKIKSVDYSQNHPGAEYFDIHQDKGDFYEPGKVSAHDFHEIIYCQSNCGAEFQIEGEQVTLQRGDILLILPGMCHGVVTYGTRGEGYSGYVVKVSQKFAQSLVKKEWTVNISYDVYKHVRTRGTVWERIDSLFLLALEELERRAIGWENALLGCSLVLLTQIVRATAVDPMEGKRSNKADLLNNILAYVELNLEEKITLEDVASRFFVSGSTITNLFNKKMNISFYKYVMQRRLWTAKNMIREGMAMEKIAIWVGFGDYSAFYRAFKQEFGMSPRQFAKDSVKE